MSRMDGMTQGARDGGVSMSRMDGMTQGARDGGVSMLRTKRLEYEPGYNMATFAHQYVVSSARCTCVHKIYADTTFDNI